MLKFIKKRLGFGKPEKKAKKATKKQVFRLESDKRFQIGDAGDEFKPHIPDSVLVDMLCSILRGQKREVAGEFVFDEGSQTITAANYVNTGTAGGVTKDPFDILERISELEERGGGRVNGDWHSHPMSAFFSATDETDQRESVAEIAKLNPDGGTYYSLVMGEYDSVMRKFWWGKDGTIYFDDATPTIGSEKVPYHMKSSYQYSGTTTVYRMTEGGVYAPAPAGKRSSYTTSRDREEAWLKGRVWSDVKATVKSRKQWSDVSDLFINYPTLMGIVGEKADISDLWRTCAYFVSLHGDEYKEILATLEENFPEAPTQLQLDVIEEDPAQQYISDDFVDDYLNQVSGRTGYGLYDGDWEDDLWWS